MTRKFVEKNQRVKRRASLFAKRNAIKAFQRIAAIRGLALLFAARLHRRGDRRPRSLAARVSDLAHS